MAPSDPLYVSDEVIAQTCAQFLFDGTDTLGAVINGCVYFLATHPDVQDRCVREVEDFNEAHGGVITPENVSELRYLDQVTYVKNK